MPKLRLALLADIHHGPDTPTKRGSAATKLLRSTTEEINHYRPDLVIELGDRINDIDKEADVRSQREVVEALRRLEAPVVHLLGNHDLVNLTAEDQAALLDTDLKHRSVDVGGCHLVFWYAVGCYRPGQGFALEAGDLEWLASDLSTTSLPSLIFTHAPLGGGSMIGNYYFEGAPFGSAGPVNADLARDLIRSNGHVVAAVAGHVHWNTLHTVDGTHYLTLQSLTETFTTAPHPAGAWGVLELDGALKLSVYGRDPFAATLPLKERGARWLPRTRRRVESPQLRVDASHASSPETA